MKYKIGYVYSTVYTDEDETVDCLPEQKGYNLITDTGLVRNCRNHNHLMEVLAETNQVPARGSVMDLQIGSRFFLMDKPGPITVVRTLTYTYKDSATMRNDMRKWEVPTNTIGKPFTPSNGVSITSTTEVK